jgi:protein Mpv17
MSVADVCTQLGMEGRSLNENTTTDNNNNNNKSDRMYDPSRTLRWAIAGLTLHGPYFLAGFARVDAYFGPATSMRVVAKKTAVAQFVLFPPYLVGLFTYMGFMEEAQQQQGNNNGRTTSITSSISQKVRQRVPEAFLGGCVYWPVANSINFAVIPATMRVPYLALSAGVWNGYLSWMNNARSNTRHTTTQVLSNKSKK